MFYRFRAVSVPHFFKVHNFRGCPRYVHGRPRTSVSMSADVREYFPCPSFFPRTSAYFPWKSADVRILSAEVRAVHGNSTAGELRTVYSSDEKM